MTKLIPPQKLPELGITLGDRQRRRLEDKGEFPRRVPVTGRRHGYVDQEIAEYLEKKIAARYGAA